MFNNTIPTAEAKCFGCSSAFAKQRKNQIYCSRACQKRATHNTARPSQRLKDSPTRRDAADRARKRPYQLAFDILTTPPSKRFSFIEKVLHAARTHDWELRQMIQDRAGKWRKNIMHWRHDLWDLLNRHCHRTRYGAKAYQVVDPNWIKQGAIRPLDYCKGKRPETLMLYVQLDSEAFLTALRQHRSNCLTT